jgi:hypothetical protein
MTIVSRNRQYSVDVVCAAVLIQLVLAVTPSLPRDSENAALFYYQAALIRPEPENYGPIIQLIRGAVPDDQLRKYLNDGRTRHAIMLAESASRMAKCDWGLLYAQGSEPVLSIIGELGHLASLLEARARTLAADGDYRSGLESCLTLRRFAAHLGDQTFLLYSRSHTTNVSSLTSIQHILGMMPPDINTLDWLEDQLAQAPGTPWSPRQALANWALMELEQWRVGAKGLSLGGSQSPMRRLAEGGTRDEVFAKAREAFGQFLDSAVEILQSDVPYEDKHRAYEQSLDRYIKQAQRVDSVQPIAFVYSTLMWADEYYEFYVRRAAYLNATGTAIKVYRIKASTGQLPESLPDGVPGDPYGGKKFEYERTSDGFVLRSRIKPLNQSKAMEFAFRVAH